MNFLERSGIQSFFKKRERKFSEKDFENWKEEELEKMEKELTTSLIQKLKLDVKVYEVVYQTEKGTNKLEVDIVSLFEGVIQHCNDKEDFSNIKMIREKQN